MKSTSLFSIIALIATSVFTWGNQPKVNNYFSIPGPVTFSNTTFNLSWSAHPTENYFKQEYLPAGQTSVSFTKMIMIEAVTGDINLSDAVKAKISELQQRKKTDPLANYQIIQNPKTGEYLLDFTMSEPGNGKTAIAEWNAYRYTKLTGNTGIKGIVLFAYSKRSYGDAVPAFLRLLKTERLKDINTLSSYTVPAIKINTIKP